MSMVLLTVKTSDGKQTSIGEGNITSYKGQLIDIDGKGAGTSENGYTLRDIRRRNKAKLTVKFEGLTQEEFSHLMSAIDSDRFELTYFCGTYKTITVHPGDRNFELIKAPSPSDSRWRLDVSFIEY